MQKMSFPEIVVAVLPFQNFSEDNKLDYFVAGFSDDLIMNLSRFRSLQIISSHSTKKINADNEEDQSIIQSLNANYLVKGSFRHYEGNIIIRTQLIRTIDDTIVWAERYDEKLTSVFDIQDDVTQRIVSTLQKHININLLSSARKKTITSLEAYDCWLKGMDQLEKGTLANDNKAREYFKQAMEIDSEYARAFAGMSLTYFNEWSCQVFERWEESQKFAYEYALKAVSLDDTDNVSNLILGRVYLYKREYEKAEHYLRKSLKLNPNDADNLIQIASSFVHLGYPKEGEKLYLKAVRLNPINVEWYYAYATMIYFELGQFEKAIEEGLKPPIETVWVDMAAFIAASFYYLGKKEKMEKYWEIYLQQSQIKIFNGRKPSSYEAIQWILDYNPYKGESNFIKFFNFLEKEGYTKPVKKKQAVSKSRLFSNTFKKDAELWEASFEGQSVYLPDVKGYHDLVILMNQPNKEIHCAELMGVQVGANNEVFVLDEKAKETYKKRVQDLLLEIEEAESLGNPQSANTLREEYDQLVDHLSKSLGLGGKNRKIDSPVERARSAVTWRIRSAIKKIEKAHPSLGKHLANSITTGTFCSYSPEKEHHWIFN